MPFVGQIVLYFNKDVQNRYRRWAAVVTDVFSETVVNLHVFVDGSAHASWGTLPTSVNKREANPPGNPVNVWDWVPETQPCSA